MQIELPKIENFKRVNELAKQVHEIHVNWRPALFFSVDEKYRGKGIGTELLNYVKDFGKENNCTDLYLTVNEENKDAINLYEKFGFKVKSIAYSMQI